MPLSSVQTPHFAFGVLLRRRSYLEKAVKTLDFEQLDMVTAGPVRCAYVCVLDMANA